MAIRSLTTIAENLFGVGRAEAVHPEAFKQIYDQYQAHVRKTLYWMVGPDAVDDLVQEVFIRLWSKFHTFRGDSSVKTWVHRVSVNVATDYLRKGRIDRTHRPLEAAKDVPAPQRDLGTQAVIHEGVTRLPEKNREVFVLFYFQGLSLEEIAVSLKLAVGTVKSRLHYARESFTEFLKVNGVHYDSE